MDKHTASHDLEPMHPTYVTTFKKRVCISQISCDLHRVKRENLRKSKTRFANLSPTNSGLLCCITAKAECEHPFKYLMTQLAKITFYLSLYFFDIEYVSMCFSLVFLL